MKWRPEWQGGRIASTPHALKFVCKFLKGAKLNFDQKLDLPAVFPDE
jgi:hypothetical protein